MPGFTRSSQTADEAIRQLAFVFSVYVARRFEEIAGFAWSCYERSGRGAVTVTFAGAGPDMRLIPLAYEVPTESTIAAAVAEYDPEREVVAVARVRHMIAGVGECSYIHVTFAGPPLPKDCARAQAQKAN